MCTLCVYVRMYVCKMHVAVWLPDRPQIAARSREFVQDVMRDDRLQREGGDAIWNSVYHAMVPGALR